MNKNLKIAIIGSRGYPYVYSGYETLVKELSERLVKKGHNVRVYCHRPLFKTKPKFINGIELIYIPSIETKFLSQFSNSFLSFIHFCFSDYELLLTVNTANGPFGILTKIFNKKTCINVDGLEWLRPKWKGLGSIYFKLSSILSTFFFDRIITDSYEMNKIYKNKFKKKSDVIAYGSTMVRTNSSKIITQLNLIKKEFYLVVGRLIPDNNSKLIIEGFLKSKSTKKLVIVGDVPFSDKYSNSVKKIKSDKIIFTGYINCQDQLSQLYKNCYCYLHGHEYGGTNPSMINALDLNCQIMALETKFNAEMLYKKETIFFKKNLISISESINLFEKKYSYLYNKNIKYILPEKYKWNKITNQYLDIFRLISKDYS